MCLIDYLGTHIFVFILPAIKLPLLERFPGLAATRSSSPSRPLGYFCFRYVTLSSSTDPTTNSKKYKPEFPWIFGPIITSFTILDCTLVTILFFQKQSDR